jgi:hypothetical protein
MFALVGVLATAAIYGLMSGWAAWRKMLLVLPALAALIVIAAGDRIGTRGAVAWWQEPLWRNLSLYAVMFAGMMFRVAWDQVDAWRKRNAQAGKRRQRRPTFDFWEFVYPVLPSLAVFQGVLWLADQNQPNLQLYLSSFQNGFFWHALLAKTRPFEETTGAKT